MLELDGATVRFGAKTAVDDVSLSLEEGQVLAVLGPSGCGKSTLLRAVAGLEHLDEGAVRWRGRDLAGVPTHRRGFALMFQDGQLFAHASVGDNVGYPLRLRGVGRAARRARVAELLELVGLPGYADRRPPTLSGGEQQRVALARSLAADPELLLLDEPLSALDRSLRERLGADLREILVSTGTTAVLVTHDHDEAFTVADQMAVMLAGRVVQHGPAAEVWRAPVDADVASFIGYSTILPLTTDRGEWLLPDPTDRAERLPSDPTERAEWLAADPTDRAEWLPGSAPDAPRGGGQIALRRQALRQDPDGTLTGTVRRAVTVSDAVHLEVDVEGLGPVAALGDDITTEAGDTVRLKVDPRGVAVLP